MSRIERGFEKQEGFKFDSLYLTKTAISDYTDAEIEFYETLQSRADAEHQQYSPDLRHFLLVKAKS